MSTKVQKWGNSLGIRIPKGIIESAKMKEGTSIEFRVEGSRITLHPKKNPILLKDLLLKMDSLHRHSEVEWGKRKGKEAW